MGHTRSTLASAARVLGAALLISAPLWAAPPATAKKPAKAPSEKQVAANKARVEELRKKGLAAAEAGKDDEAAAAFSEALKLDANDAVSHAELGKILFKQSKLPEAITQFQAAVKLDPKDSLAWYNLAYASRKDKQFDQAAGAYQKYTQLVPDDADGIFGLAESLRQANRAKEAIAAYEAYIKKETRPSEQKWVARSKERIAELSAQVEKDGAAERAAAEKAAADKAAADKLAADKLAAEKAAAERESKGGAVVAGAAGAAVVGAASAGGSSGGARPEPAPATPAGVPRVVVHGPDERPNPVKIVVPVADEAGPGAPAASGASAAAPAPAAAPSPTSSLASAKLAEGDRLFAAKDTRGALFSFQDAAQLDPKSAQARVRIGDCYARLGYSLEAGEQYNKALALDGQNLMAREGLAKLSASAAAVAPVATAAPAQPAAPTPEEVARKQYSTGVLLIREKRYAEAVAALNLALSVKPGFAEALIARGSARIGLGKFEDSVADYSAARAANPALAAPLFGLAEAYRGLGRTDKAVEMYKAFAESTAPDAPAQLKQYALQNVQALAPR